MNEKGYDILHRLVILIIIALFAQLSLVGFVVYTAYEGRVDLIQTQRAGCERAKLDRAANAHGWRIAELARRRDKEFDIADRYRKIAQGQEARSRINCRIAFPDAGVFP